MKPKICASILPKTVKEALRLIKKAEGEEADLIEIRLDTLTEYERLAEIAKHGSVPMIATNRSTKEGGKFQGEEEKRMDILLKAAESGFSYIDVELSAPNLGEFVSKLREIGVKPIISFHDFKKTPTLEEMDEILRLELKAGAELCKIITTAERIEDNLKVLEFVSKASQKSKLICFAMGELGKPSRILSPLFGAYFTIASLGRGRETAPGQLTLRELKLTYKILGVA